MDGPAEKVRVSLEHVACPVCSSERARPYARDMYRMGSVSFDLVRCDCGMVYCNPRPDGPSLAAMYDDPSYYQEGYTLGVETQGYFERREELLAAYGDAIDELVRETQGKGRLLELGSAGGFLLEAARRRGFSVAGVELSPSAVATR